MGIAAEKNLTELFQLNRIPHVYDAKLSRIRKHFIGFVGAVTERYNARFRIALQSSITFFLFFYLLVVLVLVYIWYHYYHSWSAQIEYDTMYNIY